MEYVIGAIAVVVIIFVASSKRKVDRFNKMCSLDFMSWRHAYSSSQLPEKAGIARAFLIQSLHLAAHLGILSMAEQQAIEVELRKEDPIRVVDGWLDTFLHDVNAVCGASSLAEGEARTAGALMIVCLQSVNPQGALRRFLSSRAR